MKSHKIMLAAAATVAFAGFAITGCGGEDDDKVKCGDGGCRDAAPDANPTFAISSAGCYTVESVSNITDACEFELAGSVGTTLPATYDRTTGVLALGRPVGSPVQPSLGQGAVTFNAGTLERNNTAMEGACSWNEVVRGQVKVTATDTFTITFSDTMRTFMGCGNLAPASGSCTSEWTWTLKKGACSDSGS